MTAASQPSSPEAERAVLGSVLLDREAIMAVGSWLHADHFASAKHRTIYSAMYALYSKRIPPDLALVAEELARLGQLDTIGGTPYLIDLSNGVPTAYHVEYYARAVERTAIQRQIITAAGKIARVASSGDYDSADDLLAAVNSEMAAAVARPGLGRVQPIAKAVDKLYARMDSGTPPSIPTGLQAFDRKYAGLMRGGLYILGGATGIGKTAFVGQIAQNVARAGYSVLFFSLEMPDEEIAERQVAAATGIDVSSMHRNDLHDQDTITKAVGGMAEVAGLPIYVCDDPSLSIADVAQETARTAYELGGIDLVIFDYMQLANVTSSDNRYVAIGEISKGLKRLAMQHRCAVIGLSQLAGSLDERTDKRPLIRDLYESRKLGHDSDMILMLYRDDYYHPMTDAKNIAEINVLKYRHGPTGQVLLRFDAPTNRFQNLEEYRSPDGF
jgi:replicative DNA helicase